MTSDEARAVLLAVGQSTATTLRALRVEIKLSDFVLSQVVGRSAQTVRRWRSGGDEVDIPDQAAAAIDDLRTIVAMLLKADFDGKTIKAFLLSRNVGLGQDRPLDGFKAELGAFRRVEHVTECFIAGVAPESGPALGTHGGEESEAARAESPAEPNLPHQPLGAKE